MPTSQRNLHHQLLRSGVSRDAERPRRVFSCAGVPWIRSDFCSRSRSLSRCFASRPPSSSVDAVQPSLTISWHGQRVGMVPTPDVMKPRPVPKRGRGFFIAGSARSPGLINRLAWATSRAPSRAVKQLSHRRRGTASRTGRKSQRRVNGSPPQRALTHP
jgi:hypothetical protein